MEGARDRNSGSVPPSQTSVYMSIVLMEICTTCTVICFVTLIHGLTPRYGVWLMNVSIKFINNTILSNTCTPIAGFKRFQDRHTPIRNRNR